MTWGIFKSDSVSEAYKKMKAEELKGKQHKLDVDKDGKIEGEDLAKLRAQKEEVENVEESSSNPHATNDRVYSTPTGTVHRAKPGVYGGHKKDKEEIKLKSPKALDKMDKALTKEETEIDEAMQKSDVPAYLRKQKGEKPLTVADVKGPRKDSISHKDNLAKARNEEVEQLDELSPGTLKSYVNKANPELKSAKAERQSAREGGDWKGAGKAGDTVNKRTAGIKAAKAKLNKEGLDIFSESEIDSLINEVLKASDDAGKWISDFIKSDDPRFKGDSKEQRKKRALAAYYAAQKKESVDYDSFLEEAAQGEIVKSGSKDIKHANVKDKEDDQEIMEPHSQGEQDFLDKHSVVVTDDPAGEYKSGSEKLAVAGKPKASGAGVYNGDSKLSSKDKASVKESASKDDSEEEDDSESEECSCESNEKRSGKKTYTAFKEKMNYKKGC
jgi:hypothetical protein